MSTTMSAGAGGVVGRRPPMFVSWPAAAASSALRQQQQQQLMTAALVAAPNESSEDVNSSKRWLAPLAEQEDSRGCTYSCLRKIYKDAVIFLKYKCVVTN